MKSELREIGDGCFAYLQLPGTWGYSNSGLVRSGDRALVVDTLYDARLAARMLDDYRRVADGAAMDTVVNTHANGDHCWGNQVLPRADVVSTHAAAREMEALSPRLMQALVLASQATVRLGAPGARLLRVLGRFGVGRAGALAEAAAFVSEYFGDFDFGGVTLKLPNRTFEGELDLHVGEKSVHLIEVGPAHTRGDLIVHVPADRVVFTGDILFEQAHPVMWEGPIENWIAACDRVLAMDVDTVVPGHGPLTTKASMQSLRDYLVTLRDEARRAYDAGVSAFDAAMALRPTLSPAWGESERLAANVATLYRQFSHEHAPSDPLAMMASMARLAETPA